MMVPLVELCLLPANCFEASGFIPLGFPSAVLCVLCVLCVKKRTKETAFGYLRSRFFDSFLGGIPYPAPNGLFGSIPPPKGLKGSFSPLP